MSFPITVAVIITWGHYPDGDIAESSRSKKVDPFRQSSLILKMELACNYCQYEWLEHFGYLSIDGNGSFTDTIPHIVTVSGDFFLCNWFVDTQYRENICTQRFTHET